MKEIAESKEPKSIEEILKLYDSVGLESRNMKFLTEWYSKTYSFAHLPCIDNKYLKQLSEDKTKLSVFAILIDDLADNQKTRNQTLLRKSINIPWNGTKPYKEEYLEVTRIVWNSIIESIKNYPRFEEFKDLFYFDLSQFINSIYYGSLVNTLEIANFEETNAHSPHNMMVLLFCDMDLMCSPDFDKDELGKLRPILHWTQDITHIGNILSTYKREILEQDYSSPIISIALSQGAIDKETIINNPEKALQNIEYIVPHFKHRAEENFQKIEDNINTVKTVDIADFILRIKKVFESFLQREQYWNPEEKESITESVSTMVSS
jgi:hypothetical protein